MRVDGQGGTVKRKVVVFELNEVPWQVIDDHITRHPRSNFARLLKQGASYTTQTADRGHLSPWVTWPTLHRGVDNTRHGIANLGQDIDNSQFPPIWDLALRAGRTIGVFGALQSWPPPPVVTGFFVPDMFARDPSCHPQALQAFQSLNLDLTRRNGRVVQPSIGLARIAMTMPRLVSQGLRITTVAGAGNHVLMERIEPRLGYRRPTFQAIIGFDLFLRQAKRNRPDYASFFTNHVAGLMHRFWRARYPHEYDEPPAPDEVFYGDAIEWGMRVADRQLGELMRFAEANGAILVTASSMGQGAIHPTDDPTTARLAEPGRLFRALGFDEVWERRYAMEPQVPVEVRTTEAAQRLAQCLTRVTDGAGAPVVATDLRGKVVSITFGATRRAIEDGALVIDGVRHGLEGLGIEVIHPETPGTAYHIPDGHLVFWGNGIQTDDARKRVSALEYAPTILGLLEVPRLPHHQSGLHERLIS